MNNNLTHISYILDRSGSMMDVREHTISALKEFISTQKEVEGKCTFTLCQFDDEILIPFSFVDLNSFDENLFEYLPRGMTSLYDAIGRTIVDTGAHLANLSEDQRPSKVLIIIQTDGFENSSREYTVEQIKEMISHQQEVYNWQFMFLGANQDAVFTANNLNIGNSVSYDNTRQGISGSSNYLNRTVRGYRVSAGASLAEGHKDLRN